MALSIDGTGNGTIGNLSVTTATGNIVSSGDSGTITNAMINDGTIEAAKLSGGQSGSPPIFGVRAWCSFNGTGTISIYQSGNVSSLTDHGTGNYSINFTTNMPTTAYCAIHTHNQEFFYACSQQQATVAADRYQMYVREEQNSFVDASFVAAMCIA